MTDRPQIPIVPGEQWWRLVRTTEGGPSDGEVADQVGPAMYWFLRGANPGDWPHQITETGNNEWRVGAARPVQSVKAGSEPPPLPRGRVLASRYDVPGTIPTVAGGHKYVTLRFWWRAPETQVDYPGMTLSPLGAIPTGLTLADLLPAVWNLNGADWILDRAVQPETVSPDPGDETWSEEQLERAGSALKWTGTALLVSGGIGLALYLAFLAISMRRAAS